MKNRILHILLLAAGILTVSCVKSQLETTYNKQEDQIDQYITKNMVVQNSEGGTDTLRVVRNGGSNRLVRKEGTGEELGAGGYVSFYYAGYSFSGSISASNLFTTNMLSVAEEAGWKAEDVESDIYEAHLSDAEFIEGLKKGLEGVRAGEECEIIFSAKYGFGNKALGIIPAKTALLYRIWVIGVTND